MNSKKRFIIIAAIILVIAAVAAVIVMGVMGITPEQLLSKDSAEFKPGNKLDEMTYQNGSDCAFGFLDEKLVVASETWTRVYEFGSEGTITQSTIMTRPAVDINNGFVAVYDIGGNELQILDADSQWKTLTAEGNIVSASVNKNGWLALCAQESGYNGTVTVLNKNAESTYKWYSGEGYIIDASVSHNNKKMAALTVSGSGSKVSVFKLNSEDVYGEYDIGSLAILVDYTGNDTIRILTEEEVIYIDSKGEEKARYSFEEQYLKNIDFEEDGGFTAVLSDFQVGTDSIIVSVDANGEEKGRLDVKEEVLDVSSGESYNAVLYSGRIEVYYKNMTPYAQFSGTGTTKEIKVLNDGQVVAAGDFSAAVYGVK